MATELPTTFQSVIEEHLALKARNAGLGERMPLDRYETQDPFENHPLFKSEEQARLEETLETAESATQPAAQIAAEPAAVLPAAQPAVQPTGATLPWPGDNNTDGPALADDLWSQSRDFDWGD